MTAFRDSSVALDFVENRRKAIPYGSDQINLMLRLVRELVDPPKRIVDLGCGDGILAKALLSIYPDSTALLIDQSLPMLAKASESMADFAGRAKTLEADMTESLASLLENSSVDVVVSGYAIHHLSHERKKSLYGEIFGALKPGGLFLNIEHVASVDSTIERIWDDAYIEHTASIQQVSVEQAAKEYHARPDKGDNILATVELQVSWLKEIGFEHADCYFKWLELAVFGGKKPTSPLN